jgi:branched-chain amino acid transport system permease protein
MLILASVSGFIQYVVDGFVNGSAYGLLGLSFGLIVAVTGRFHFAWAASYAIAGFFATWLANKQGLAPVPAVVVAIAGAIVFSCLCELLLYRPIGKRLGPQALLAIFVASFGVTIAVGNLISWIVGNAEGADTLTWLSTTSQHVGKITFTTLDVIWVASVWALGIATWALLRFTPLGRRIRAVQANEAMSEAVGINPGRTYIVVFAIASLLGGWAAVLTAMKYAGTPNMGLTPVFYAFVVAFAAGLGRSPLRIMAVGTLLGVVEGASAQVLNVNWQQVVVFAILLAYLVVKAAYAWRPRMFSALRPRRLAATTATTVQGG